jgi:hypothetical protein
MKKLNHPHTADPSQDACSCSVGHEMLEIQTLITEFTTAHQWTQYQPRCNKTFPSGTASRRSEIQPKNVRRKFTFPVSSYGFHTYLFH